MIKRPYIILLALIVIAALGGAVMVVMTQKKPDPKAPVPIQVKKVQPRKVEDTAEGRRGDQAPPGQPAFESTVRDLLFVSLDDVKRGFISTRVDYAALRSYFDDAGWADYQAYLAEQKIILRKRMGAFGPTPQSKAEFKPKSQDYDNLGNAQTGFSVDVYFCFGVSDAYACDEDTHELNVAFNGDVWSPQSIKISKWKVTWE